MEDEELDAKYMSVDMGRMAQKRTNKLMQLTRLQKALKAIIRKLDYEKESQLIFDASEGNLEKSTTYDAYLIVKYEIEAVRKALAEMDTVPRVANILYFLAHEYRNYDYALYKELKERAGARLAKITQAYIDSEKED